MDKQRQLQLRIRYFASLICIFVIIHTIFALFHSQIHYIYFYIYSIIYVCFLVALIQLKKLPNWAPYLFILTLNCYIMLEYTTEMTYSYVIFLAYPIFIATFFQVFPVIFLVIAVTYVELFFIFTQLSSNFSNQLSRHDVELVLFFFFMLLSTTILYMWVEKKILQSINSQNSLMKNQLLSQEGYLRLFFDTAKDGIAVFDLSNRLIDLNPAFEELYGYSREELLGREIFFVSEESEAAARERTEKIRQGSVFHFETKDKRKDGKMIDVLLTLSPIHDKRGKIIAMSVISRDISFKKETEKLKLQTERLQLAGEIAAGVAHEIRNPMTVISGFIQMMNSDKNSPSYRYTKLIESEIKRIEYIVSEFLQLSKPSPSLNERFFLRSVLNDVLSLFGPNFDSSSITLHHKWNAHHMWLQGDESHVKQVFINIIKNAIESIENSGEIHIYSYSKNHEDYIVVIRDTGTGMTEEVLENLYNPFYTTKAEGTGLGMLISEKIMADVNGKIEVDSVLGKGTTFFLHFKKVSPPENEESYSE